MFKSGDIVEKKNGSTFSNEKITATVDCMDIKFNTDIVWLQETKSWLAASSVQLVQPLDKISELILDLEQQQEEAELKVKAAQEKAKEAQKTVGEAQSKAAKIKNAIEALRKL